MGEILSLSKARKVRARAEKENQAAENRAKFGRTKAEKRLDSVRKDKDARHLDSHRRDED